LEQIFDFFMHSLDPIAVDRDKNKFAMLSAASATHDIYICMMKLPEINATSLFVETQLLSDKERSARKAQGSKPSKLAGPKLLMAK
jgi:hypothetical protein